MQNRVEWNVIEKMYRFKEIKYWTEFLWWIPNTIEFKLGMEKILRTSYSNNVMGKPIGLPKLFSVHCPYFSLNKYMQIIIQSYHFHHDKILEIEY